MVSDCSLVAESLTGDPEVRRLVENLDHPTEWEIEEDEGKFFFRPESLMFPAIDESMEEQLRTLWYAGVRGEITLHDVDSPYDFDRYSLVDEGIKHQKGEVVFKERPSWTHHRGGPFHGKV